MHFTKAIIVSVCLALLGAVVAACGGEAPGPDRPSTSDRAPGGAAPSAERTVEGPITVYSGRNEELVGPLIEMYEEQSGNEVEVRYSGSSELAATLLEEGSNTPADVFFSQDAGGLGALQDEGGLAPLPEGVLNRVDPRFRSEQGRWVGTSGRARVVAYNRGRLNEAQLPPSILNFVDPSWRGRIGWAPTNASLQSFVTALRVTRGEETARRWLEGIVANDPEVYENNIAVRDAVADGEVDLGFINHYYIAQAVAEEGGDYPVGAFYPPGGDPGALVNVAGAAQLAASDNPGGALDFIEYLLSPEAQRYLSEETKEYPVIDGVEPAESLRPLSGIEQPDIDLSDLDDLDGTLRLMRETGAL